LWADAVKTQARIAARTQRLQRFVVMVKAAKIAPFSDYAKRQWPSHPEDFYAEAFSLWLTDREFLEINARAVLDWFDQGHYRD
jgi:hypothetical protein